MDTETDLEFARRISTMERKISNIYEILQRPEPTFDTSKVSEQVLALIREGQTVQAIQQHRLETGCGLAEAKDVVDNAGVTG